MSKNIAIISILCFFLCKSQLDSTVIFIEKKGLYKSPLVFRKGFKTYSLTKCDTSLIKHYNEFNINWIKCPKTRYTSSGFRIDTTEIQGNFLVAANFSLPRNFFIYNESDYVSKCEPNYLFPGKKFTLESFLFKSNGADYVTLESYGIVSDSLVKVNITANNKPIATYRSIPYVALEGYFNIDGQSDFVLFDGHLYKAYLSNGLTYSEIKCEFLQNEIPTEF